MWSPSLLVSLYRAQVGALLYKHILASLHSPAWWIVMLLPSFMNLVVLNVLDHAIPKTYYPPIIPQDSFISCEGAPLCHVVLISPADSIIVQRVIRELVANNSRLTSANESSTVGDIISFASYNDLIHYYNETKPRISAAFMFDAPPPSSSSNTAPQKGEYDVTMWYQSTVERTNMLSYKNVDVLYASLSALHNGVLGVVSDELNGTSSPSSIHDRVGVAINGYHPHRSKLPYRRLEYISVDGAQVTWILSFMLQSMYLLTMILQEKTQKLRQGLTFMGMRSMSYILSWSLFSFLGNILSILLFLVTGYITGFDFFMYTDFFVLFFLFLLSVQAMNQLLILVAIVANNSLGTSISVIVCLLSLMLHILNLPDMSFRVISSLFLENMIKPFPFHVLLSWLPFWFLSVGLSDISSKSCRFSSDSGFPSLPLSPSPLTGYVWSDTYNHIIIPPSINPNEYVPTIAQIYGILVGMIVFYYVLTLYLDCVLDSGHGAPLRWNFLFQSSFWRHSSFPPSSSTLSLPPPPSPSLSPTSPASSSPYRYNDDSALPSSSSTTQISSPELIEMSLISTTNNSRIPSPSLHHHGSPQPAGMLEAVGRLQSLQKIYKRGKIEKVAVRDFSLDLYAGRTLCLLGHNGAGKSTLIGMLTGLIAPTQGDANLHGAHITRDIDQIRSMSGVCPQHDVLWAGMTASQHLRMFCRLKQVPSHEIEQVVRDLLAELGLSKAADKRVGKFSGGMKRRLSVAISCIGNPRMIFLDEPTSGLDPSSRRMVWRLVQKMKASRLVILTTHSMEEADVLGDDIAIMAKGELKCFGGSLALKELYGDGYRMNIVARSSVDSHEIKDIMARISPHVQLQAETGSALVFTLPCSLHPDEYAAIFRDIDMEVEDDRSPIEAWSISHTTLEEVFRKVTRTVE
eukprot:TRINITY_DN10992_c0_g1_i5.p1 TRINITY_DN10992_c0_g1~~TRINITY_DN10992_c0_g1_i5.p1  ORF type:complete len:912 (+),score=123.41 TRINITY_DN10992_c0_g1_i5:2733-5468(+)